MKRFSKLFWFTAIAGISCSTLLSHVLVGHLATQLHDMVTLCAPRNDVCSVDAIDRAFRTFCLMAVAGNVVLFWLAYAIGRGFIKPAATDAAQ